MKINIIEGMLANPAANIMLLSFKLFIYRKHRWMQCKKCFYEKFAIYLTFDSNQEKMFCNFRFNKPISG